MPWTPNQRIEWGLDSYSHRYDFGWIVPKDGHYDAADDQRSKAAQRVLGIPESKIGHYPFEQLYGTNDDGDGGWIWHPSLYWSDPSPLRIVQNKLRLKRHLDALAVFRATHGSIYQFPIREDFHEGRTDRGVDLETAVGSSIRAIGSGVVTATPPGSSIAGLGQIVFRLDHAYQGWRHVFIFHLNNCYVRVGQRVAAGQVLARSTRRPPGAEDMPGHIEYGFALNGFGDIQPAVDASHNAPSGNAMHALLRQLAPGRIGPHPIIA